MMQTHIFFRSIDVGKIAFRVADSETGKWLDAPEFRRLERLLVFLRRNAEKIVPLKNSSVVFEDNGKLMVVHHNVAPDYYPVGKFTIPPYTKKWIGWKKLQDAYRLLVKSVVDELDF